jgi:glucokinase
VNAFNPCLVILGGGVVEGWAGLVERVAEAVRRRALPSPAGRVRVVRAQLGGQAGVIGAAAWARPDPDRSRTSAPPPANPPR